MQNEVDICVLCHNQSDVTRQFVSHIADNTSGVDYKLWMLDNGSDEPLDRTKGVLKWFKANTKWWGNRLKPRYRHVDLDIERVEENLGFAKGNNRLAAKGTAPWICFINNDAFPDNAAWLSELICTGKDYKYDAVGPISNRVLGIQDEKWTRIVPERHWAKILSGFCIVVRRDVFEDLGGWCEDFMNGDEDVDLSLRIRDRAWHRNRRVKVLGVDRTVYIDHMCSQSLAPWCEKNGESVEEHFRATHNILIEKHGRLAVNDMWFWENIRLPMRKWANIGVLPNGKLSTSPAGLEETVRFIGRGMEKVISGAASGNHREERTRQGRRGVNGRATHQGRSGDEFARRAEAPRSRQERSAAQFEPSGSAKESQGRTQGETRRRPRADSGNGSTRAQEYAAAVQLLSRSHPQRIAPDGQGVPKDGTSRFHACDWADRDGHDETVGRGWTDHWAASGTALISGISRRGGECPFRRVEGTVCGTCATKEAA